MEIHSSIRASTLASANLQGLIQPGVTALERLKFQNVTIIILRLSFSFPGNSLHKQMLNTANNVIHFNQAQKRELVSKNFDIFYGTQRVVFEQHKVSLYLRDASSLLQSKYFVRELLCARRNLVGIKASVHLLQLRFGSEANLLFDIHPAWSYEGWIKPVQVISSHENNAFFR